MVRGKKINKVHKQDRKKGLVAKDNLQREEKSGKTIELSKERTSGIWRQEP